MRGAGRLTTSIFAHIRTPQPTSSISCNSPSCSGFQHPLCRRGAISDPPHPPVCSHSKGSTSSGFQRPLTHYHLHARKHNQNLGFVGQFFGFVVSDKTKFLGVCQTVLSFRRVRQNQVRCRRGASSDSCNLPICAHNKGSSSLGFQQPSLCRPDAGSDSCDSPNSPIPSHSQGSTSLGFQQPLCRRGARSDSCNSPICSHSKGSPSLGFQQPLCRPGAGSVSCSSPVRSLQLRTEVRIVPAVQNLCNLVHLIKPPCIPTRRSFTSGFQQQRLRSRTSAAMAKAKPSFDPELARDPAAQPLAPAELGERYMIALCQLSVTADKGKNVAHAKAAIEKAAEKGAKLIVLPEMWNCPYSNDSFPVYAEEVNGPCSAMLSKVAAEKGVTIIGGSIPERFDGRLYNTCYVFGKNGELKGKLRKLHLFDIDIPGKISYKESDVLTGGDGLTVVDTELGRIGVGICYDIRFPELAMLYASRGVHLIAYPGAFNMTTGPLHWELLQKSRAVDNQLYVVTCSPARDATAGYVAWGHSTIVGPFGEIVATTEHEEATVFGEIEYAQIHTRRLNMPLESQRRGDLYSLVDKTRR